MRLITANIGRGISVQHVRADFETIKRLRGIVGFQEIDEADAPDEHALLKAVMSSGYTLCGMEHYVPTAVPKNYEVIWTRQVKGSPGLAHYSPTRFFTVTMIKVKPSIADKALKRHEKVIVHINTHYPAGGYHGNRPAKAKAELKKRWDYHFAKHRSLVKHFVDKGYTVFYTADTNRAEMPKVHPREVRVVTAGIDSISYIEGGVKVKFLSKNGKPLHSDHPALYADFKLT